MGASSRPILGGSQPSAADSRRSARRALALAAALLLAGCNDMGAKEQTGTGVGAAIGGVAGALLGHGTGGKIAAAAAGAAIGGFIGNRIGAQLDDNDKKAIAQRSQEALASSADNSTITWNSDHSDAKASVTTENTRVETRQVAVVRDAKVEPTPDIEPIGRTYQAKTTTNIRLGPSTNTDVAGQLAAGSRITAVGKVKGQPWIMVARGGRTIGYVSQANVEPAPPKTGVATSSGPVATASAAGSAPAPASHAGFDLDSDAPVRAPADLDALPADTKVDRINAAVPCRDVKTTVTSKGQSETTTQSACKSPDGTWELL
jgi:surface antigen